MLIRVTGADPDLPWQVLQIREIPPRPGPGWDGYRDVTVAVNIHVPAGTGDHTVTGALDDVLGKLPADWADWLVGAPRVISSGYPDAGPPTVNPAT